MNVQFPPPAPSPLAPTKSSNGNILVPVNPGPPKMADKTEREILVHHFTVNDLCDSKGFQCIISILDWAVFFNSHSFYLLLISCNYPTVLLFDVWSRHVRQVTLAQTTLLRVCCAVSGPHVCRRQPVYERWQMRRQTDRRCQLWDAVCTQSLVRMSLHVLRQFLPERFHFLLYFIMPAYVGLDVHNGTEIWFRTLALRECKLLPSQPLTRSVWGPPACVFSDCCSTHNDDRLALSIYNYRVPHW